MLARIGVKFFQIVGLPSDLEWSQLQVVNSSSMEEMTKGGGLSVLMSVVGESASSRGNEWLQAVVEGFLKNLDQDRVVWLKDTVKWFEGVAGSEDSLLLTIVLPHDGGKRALYLAGKGGIRVYVSRGGIQKLIWEGNKGITAVSGWLNDGDVVVAGTSEFVDEVWGKLEGEVVDMVEESRESIGIHEKRSRMAGLVMLLGEKQDEEEIDIEAGGSVLEGAIVTSEKVNELESVGVKNELDDVNDQEIEVEVADHDNEQDTAAVESEAKIVETEPETSNQTSVSIDDEKIDDNFKMVEQVVEEDEVIEQPKVEQVVEQKSEGFVTQNIETHLQNRVMGGQSVGQLTPEPEKRAKTRRIAMALGVIFLVIFGVALGFGIVKAKKDKEDKKFAELVNPIEYNLAEAGKLKTINQVRARGLVEEAKTKYGSGGEFENNRFGQQYKELGNKIDQTWKDVSGERGADGKLFADLGVIRDGFKIFALDYNESWGFLAVDREKGSIALIDGEGKMKIVAGGDKYKTVRSLALNSKGGYFLTDDGIYMVDLKTQVEKKLIEKDDEIWSEVGEIGLFGSSVYLQGKIDVWKYPGLDSGVGKRQRWFKVGVEPDLSKVVDMQIATDIYMLGEDEGVMKFVSGAKSVFDLRKVTDHGKAAKMAISEEKKELYVLENDKKRVVVYSLENGEYKKQLIWETLGEAQDLVVSDPMGKLLVGIGSKMFEVVFE